MLTFRPLTDSFALAWAHDTALDRSRDDFDHAYETACETGDFSALTIDGQRPTLFVFRPIDTVRLRRLMDVQAGPQVFAELAFRMALTKIEDAGSEPLKLDRKVDPAYPLLGAMVSVDAMRAIDHASVELGQMAGAITHALGDVVLNRSSGVLPKSARD